MKLYRRAWYSGLAMSLFAVPAPGSARAQGATNPSSRITGVVTDSLGNHPVAGVQVTVTGGRLGAITDAEGHYTINGVAPGTHTIDARRLGFKPLTRPGIVVNEGAATTLNLKIVSVPLMLEAVVSTGVVDPTSGTRVPFTVGRVDAENAPVPSANAVETIQGKIAGVTVVPSGQPGTGTNIVLRSPTSINKSNSPLIVVDGVILSQAFDGSTADLESLDIESVEVVKGAAAASLYGSRASSGVIQIRTKRGASLAEGPTHITVRSEIGTSSIANKKHWAKYNYYMVDSAATTYLNAAGAPVTRATRVPKPIFSRFQDSRYPDPTYDQIQRFFDPGQTYKNSVTMAQNGGRTNWLLSLVNSNQDGVVLNAGTYGQNDVRLNLDHQLRDDWRISFSGFGSRSKRRDLNANTFFQLINQAPDVNLLQPDPDGTPYIFQPDPEGREPNPLYVLATQFRERKSARTLGSLASHYGPLSWLSFDADVSYDRSDRNLSYFLDQGLKSPTFGSAGDPGRITQTQGTTDALNASTSANLLGHFKALTLRSTLRALIEREDNSVVIADGTNFAAPGVRSLDNAQNRFVSSTLESVRSTGYFGTLGANYGDRYIFDGLIRHDGSSLFGPEERWHKYYRWSGAWRMASESWWPFKGLINEFKPRISRGTAGGRPSFADQFETFDFTTGGGLEKNTLGNKALKPELSTETEFGLDMIMKDRYSVQLSYAKNRVTDQLIQIPLPGFYGYTTQWQNAGTVEGNTVEATFQAQILRGPKLTWQLGLVADRSRNRITEFDRSCFTTNTIAYRCAGSTLGSMYGFAFLKQAAGLPTGAQARAAEFQANDDGLLVWVGPGNTYKEGETKKLWGTSTTIGTNNYGWGMPILQQDANGNTAVRKIGDGTPRFHYGISNNVGWHDLTFYTLLDVNVGGNAYNQTNQRMYQYGRSSDVDQAGKPQEDKKIVDYYVNLYSANNPVDYFVEDAGFVKLREISMRYQLPRSFSGALSRVGASGASLSLIGRNVLTWTKYKGYDPEVGTPNVRLDSFDYPRYRTFTTSVEINF
ncbi:MAG TPA: SusC/RagA family TonB-linked outer membrane protein [Gemmatimonadaceae bacterium]|nr:SusC/RagA family TonB-linked outer membrane protein [Gemmatimonadaceae bacterium]